MLELHRERRLAVIRDVKAILSELDATNTNGTNP
jgi:hypothetical protein